MLEALEASSLHGFQRSTVATRTIFREPLHCREKHEQKTVFCSRRLRRNRIPVSSIVSAGNVIEGNLSCLTCLFGHNRRPSPQCLRLLPLLGKLHQTRSWLNRSLLAANQRCRLCSPGIGPTSTAGFSASSAMRRLPSAIVARAW